VIRAAALLLLVGWVAGCASVPPRVPATPLPPDDPRPEAWLAALAERAEARRALRGRAHLAVDAEADGVHLRSHQVLVVERPARLRVEILGLLRQTVAVLVTDGERFEFVSAGDRASYESGPVYPGLLWEVAYLALEPADVVDLVLGAPRPVRAGLARAGAEESAEGFVRVALADDTGRIRRRLVFDADGRLRRWTDLAHDGSALAEVRFEDYAEVDGSSLAHAISLSVAGGATRAELSLSDVQLNPELPAGIFRLRADAASPPAASRAQEAARGGAAR